MYVYHETMENRNLLYFNIKALYRERVFSSYLVNEVGGKKVALVWYRKKHTRLITWRSGPFILALCLFTHVALS